MLLHFRTFSLSLFLIFISINSREAGCSNQLQLSGNVTGVKSVYIRTDGPDQLPMLFAKSNNSEDVFYLEVIDGEEKLFVKVFSNDSIPIKLESSKRYKTLTIIAI